MQIQQRQQGDISVCPEHIFSWRYTNRSPSDSRTRGKDPKTHEDGDDDPFAQWLIEFQQESKRNEREDDIAKSLDDRVGNHITRDDPLWPAFSTGQDFEIPERGDWVASQELRSRNEDKRAE